MGTAAKSNTPEAIKTGQDTFGNSTLGSILLNSLPGDPEALENLSTAGVALAQIGAIEALSSYQIPDDSRHLV